MENFVVKKIECSETLDLRQKVLRPFSERKECQFPEDQNPRGFHLGVLLNQQQLISIGSFHPAEVPAPLREALESRATPIIQRPYRLRGMATDPDFRGQGYGAALLKRGEQELRDLSCDFLWFNARQVAYKFYEGLGFKYFGEEFEMSGIGPHKIMYKAIGPS